MAQLPDPREIAGGAAGVASRATARARRWSARHRAVPRLVAAAVVAAGAWAGGSAAAGFAAARDRWGERVPVAVADADLAPGDVADAAHVSLREWPAALVPPGAWRAIPGTPVLQHVAAGEVIGAGDVAAGTGATGLVPAGQAAVAVPLDATRRPPLAVGDPVAVVAGGERLGAGTVVALDQGGVVVAVPAGDAPLVASAALDGAVALLLEPG